MPIIQVVHERENISEELQSFVTLLKSDGAFSVTTVSAKRIDCVLKSLIVRMLAFKLVKSLSSKSTFVTFSTS